MEALNLSAMPVQRHYNLTHYHQRYDWDCGISCILMILANSQRNALLENFNSICEDEGFGSSTWTIDLCYLLWRFHVRHEYYTQTLGIDPNYSLQNYYAKIIEKDEQRVTRRFKEASALGLRVEQRTLEMEELLHHLAHHGPIILLTNASLLRCDICKQKVLEMFGYTGHYVVLCGYDLKTNKIYYRNPEVADEHVCVCSMEAMDIARKAYGTDEDTILIFSN